MPKNRFSDLPKSINNEGWREVMTKEKNPQNLLQIRSDAREEEESYVVVVVFFFFWLT